ncbi:MAG: hypothetical protein WA445_15155 [Pseudolabrys sp.]|jgi:hypothetical protein
MRRHARAHPLVRRRLSKLLKDLKSEAPSSWPRHFHLAWGILHHELKVAEPNERIYNGTGGEHQLRNDEQKEYLERMRTRFF